MRRIFQVIILLSVFFAKAQETDIKGNWVITSQTPRGEQELELSISQEGDIIKAVNKKETFSIQLALDSVKFQRVISSPMGKIKVNYKGILVGNKMSGESTMLSGPMSGRTMTWDAIRKE